MLKNATLCSLPVLTSKYIINQFRYDFFNKPWFWACLGQHFVWLRVIKIEYSEKKKRERIKKTHPLDYFSPIRRMEFETHDNLKRYLCESADLDIKKAVSQLKIIIHSCFIRVDRQDWWSQATINILESEKRTSDSEITWPTKKPGQYFFFFFCP